MQSCHEQKMKKTKNVTVKRSYDLSSLQRYHYNLHLLFDMYFTSLLGMPHRHWSHDALEWYTWCSVQGSGFIRHTLDTLVWHVNMVFRRSVCPRSRLFVWYLVNCATCFRSTVYRKQYVYVRLCVYSVLYMSPASRLHTSLSSHSLCKVAK